MNTDDNNKNVTPSVDVLINHLENIKSELEKNVAIQKAQIALDELVAVRYEENLELFKQNFPNIYKHYINYKPSDKYKLVCNENGEPNLMIVKTGRLIYGKSPFADCRKKVDDFMKNQSSPFMALSSKTLEKDDIGQLHLYIKNNMCEEVAQICSEQSDMKRYESIPTMFMFGLGLGFQLGYLYETMTPINLFVVEPDEELFYYSLCVFDYTSLINYLKQEHLGINFYLLSDPEEFVTNVNRYLINHAGATLPELAMIVYGSSVMRNFVAKVKRDFSSLIHTSGFFDDLIFGISHSIRNISNGIPILKKGRMPKFVSERPVVIVGNGPSLDDDIDLLAKYQDKFFIIACGTAFSALCKRNICPDIYVAIERVMNVYDSLIAIDTHREFFDETVCLSLDVVHPKVFNLFKHRIAIVKGNELMPHWLAKNRLLRPDICLITRVNPLVSNLGIEVASQLGFEKIYLLGIDNGSVGSQSHSKFSLYYDDDNNLKEPYKDMTLDQMPFEMPGNFVPTVKTNLFFKLAARVMEATITNYEKKSSYFNCSNGMKLQKCQPLHFGEVNWAQMPSLDKKMFRKILMMDALTIGLDLNKAKKRFYIDNFNSALDQIYHDWQTKPATRAEFILREELHSDYLQKIAKDGLVGARAVYSSLANFFNQINKVLYHFQDEEKAINQAHKLLKKYLYKFFTGCRVIYSNATEYEIGKHAEIYSKIIEDIAQLEPEDQEKR